MTAPARKTGLIPVAAAAAALIAAGGVVAWFWAELGDAEISPAGWGALVLGVVLTLALGVGLMSLVFISNRRGFDERGDHRR